MAQVVGLACGSFDGVSRTAQIAPSRSLSNVASAAALTEPLAPAPPESSAPQSGSVSPPNAATVQSRTITTAPVYLTNVIEEPAQTSGIVTRLNALIAVVGHVLAHLPFHRYPATAIPCGPSAICGEARWQLERDRRRRTSHQPVEQHDNLRSVVNVGLSTSQVSEGANLYFTNARVASYMNSSSTIPTAAGGHSAMCLRGTDRIGHRSPRRAWDSPAEAARRGAALPARSPTRPTYRPHSTPNSRARRFPRSQHSPAFRSPIRSLPAHQASQRT